MIERTERLQALDRRWEQQAYGNLSFDEALVRFSSLWREALSLLDDPIGDWRADLDADLAVARAVNGLPPS